MSDSKNMDSKERAAIIREGNTAFNSGDYPKARELYLKSEYKDGLIRLGDYYMYEKKLPILAYGYYKKAGHVKQIDEIFQRMLYALSIWIGPEKFIVKEQAPKELDPNDFTVHPILKQKALEILSRKN
jgi:hypothetical protein